MRPGERCEMLAPGREVMAACAVYGNGHRRMKVHDEQNKAQIERRFDAFDRCAFDPGDAIFHPEYVDHSFRGI
jgi:hypothetical protein